MSGTTRPAAIYLYSSSFMLHFASVPSPNKTCPSPPVHRGPSGAFVASWSHLQLGSTQRSVQPSTSISKQHFSPPHITPQSSPDRHPQSQNRDPVSPRTVPTLRESAGDKLVEEADHPAQLPLAALLAVAHGSSSQRWGGTQPHPLPAAKQPPGSCEQRAMPGAAPSRSARSEPAGIGVRCGPAGRAAAAPAARLRRPRSRRRAAGSFARGCSGAGGQRDTELGGGAPPGAGAHTSGSVRGSGMSRFAAPGRALPPAAKLRGAAGAASGRCGVPGSPAVPASPPAEADGRFPGWQSLGLPPAPDPPLGTSSTRHFTPRLAGNQRQVGMATRRLHRSR